MTARMDDSADEYIIGEMFAHELHQIKEDADLVAFKLARNKVHERREDDATPFLSLIAILKLQTRMHAVATRHVW